MKEMEEHHIVPKCICKRLGLPRSFRENPQNKRMLEPTTHREKHLTTHEDLYMVGQLFPKGVKCKETRVITLDELLKR